MHVRAILAFYDVIMLVPVAKRGKLKGFAAASAAGLTTTIPYEEFVFELFEVLELRAAEWDSGLEISAFSPRVLEFHFPVVVDPSRGRYLAYCPINPQGANLIRRAILDVSPVPLPPTAVRKCGLFRNELAVGHVGWHHSAPGDGWYAFSAVADREGQGVNLCQAVVDLYVSMLTETSEVVAIWK